MQIANVSLGNYTRKHFFWRQNLPIQLINGKQTVCSDFYGFNFDK